MLGNNNKKVSLSTCFTSNNHAVNSGRLFLHSTKTVITTRKGKGSNFHIHQTISIYTTLESAKKIKVEKFNTLATDDILQGTSQGLQQNIFLLEIKLQFY